MTKSYSEQRQAAYFRAARELRKIASRVLDDVQNELELTSETTLRWAVTTARYHAEQATQLEDLGHECCIGSSRAENELYKSKQAYDASIDAFENRVKAQPGGVYRLGCVKHGAETAAAHASS